MVKRFKVRGFYISFNGYKVGRWKVLRDQKTPILNLMFLYLNFSYFWCPLTIRLAQRLVSEVPFVLPAFGSFHLTSLTPFLSTFTPSRHSSVPSFRRKWGTERPTWGTNEGVRDRTTKGRKGRGKGTERSLVSSVTLSIPFRNEVKGTRSGTERSDEGTVWVTEVSEVTQLEALYL